MNWMQVPVQPKPTITKAKTRIGNLGHLTRIANRMIQASASNSTIQIHLQVYSLYQHLNQFQVTIHVTITGEPNIHLPKPRNPDIPWREAVFGICMLTWQVKLSQIWQSFLSPIDWWIVWSSWGGKRLQSIIMFDSNFQWLLNSLWSFAGKSKMEWLGFFQASTSQRGWECFAMVLWVWLVQTPLQICWKKYFHVWSIFDFAYWGLYCGVGEKEG